MHETKPIRFCAPKPTRRTQIARWVGTSVKNAPYELHQRVGSGTNKQVLDYMESISKQVADQTLVGVERDDLWVDAMGPSTCCAPSRART
jgi:hypothetical protein